MAVLESSGCCDATGIKSRLCSFKFIAILCSMESILAATNSWSEQLQTEDSSVVSAINLIKVTRQNIEMLRRDTDY